MKIFLNGIHAVVKWTAHIILIPVVALLKATIAGLTHLHDAAEKV